MGAAGTKEKAEESFGKQEPVRRDATRLEAGEKEGKQEEQRQRKLHGVKAEQREELERDEKEGKDR